LDVVDHVQRKPKSRQTRYVAVIGLVLGLVGYLVFLANVIAGWVRLLSSQA
jgi:hypothetical protein